MICYNYNDRSVRISWDHRNKLSKLAEAAAVSWYDSGDSSSLLLASEELVQHTEHPQSATTEIISQNPENFNKKIQQSE